MFDCSCFPLLRLYNEHKLDFHTQKCVFISYSPIHKGNKCLDKTGKVFVARHVTFNELEFPYSKLFFKEKKFTPYSSTSIPSYVHFFLLKKSNINDSRNKEPSTAASSPALSPTSVSHSSQQSFTSQSYIYPQDIQILLNQQYLLIQWLPDLNLASINPKLI